MANLETPQKGIYAKAEFNRFGLISVVLLVVGCMGGLTVGLGAVNEIWSLAVVVIPTMITLSLLLAVAPMRYILNSAAVACAIDMIFIIYYLLT